MATETVTIHQPKDALAKFTYLEWHDHYRTERPFQALDILHNAVDKREGNVSFKEGGKEVVHDVRGHEQDFTLDKHGFLFANAPTSLSPSDFQDDEKIKEKYLPECETYLKQYFDNVDQVHIIHYRVRCTNSSDPNSPTGPAKVVHVDQSGPHVTERIHKAFPDCADFLLRGHVRLINLWRPINGPIQNWPLAVCDANSLPEENLIETDRIRKAQKGNTRFVIQAPSMKWYYQSKMEDNTLLVFKSYESQDGVAKYASHCSFPLPTAGPMTPPRESIELRAFVFTYPRDEST
uniref:ScyL2 n=1 Tax=Scytalidium album TaxID=1525810 RepID=A0A8A5D4W2_9PEZI|nr:ScyL2 [Scytalidium album]